MRHMLRTQLFAALIGVVCVACPTAKGQTYQRYGGPLLTDAVADRLAVDLALSDFQRTKLDDLVTSYRHSFDERMEQFEEDRNVWRRDFWLELVPELDESVDISDLPIARQAKITMMRLEWRKGEPPFEVLTPEARAARNAQMREWGQSTYEAERAQRESLLAGLQSMLAEEQLERWPRAMRRLTINLEDQNPEGRYGWDDPRWKVDMPRVLWEATDEGAELHPIADAVRVPDVVLMDEAADEAMADLAAIVLAFEQAYARALDDYSWKKLQIRYERTPLHNSGDTEAAARLDARERRMEQRVWQTRRRFVEDVAAFTGELLGTEARERWLRRCHEQFCPVLYLEESTDILYEKIKQIDGLVPDALDAIEAVFEEHDAWREDFKARIVRLEILESYTSDWYEEGDEQSARDRLKAAYNRRHEQAAQINRRMRSLLPPEHHPAFDKWLAAYRKETTVMGREINVRP